MARSDRCRGPACWAPAAGPARGFMGAAAGRCRPGAAAAGADQRQADQRRGVVAVDGVQQRDAQGLALGAAGAVIGLLQPQVAFDLGVLRSRKCTATGASSPAQTRCPAAPRPRRSGRPPAAAHRLQLRHGAVMVPGLPMGWPSRSATWSAPITTAPGCARPPRAPSPAPAAAPGRPALRRARGLVDLGRHARRAAAGAQQFAPVARGGTQDQQGGIGVMAGIVRHAGPSRAAATLPA
jgi:hypothetical protein